jgi:isoaspartyl peptidase/L-asparaginase-like protein (Ntn-hydrolase superfamily)
MKKILNIILFVGLCCQLININAQTPNELLKEIMQTNQQIMQTNQQYAQMEQQDALMEQQDAQMYNQLEQTYKQLEQTNQPEVPASAKKPESTTSNKLPKARKKLKN